MSEDQPVPMRDSFVPGWPKELAVPYSGPYRAKVVEVHDGDTLTLEAAPFPDDRKEIQVRIYGINAPELSTPEGKAARDHLRDMVPPGTPVRFTLLVNEAGEATRSFTRYVGSVEAVGHTADRGIPVVADIAEFMVANGHAIWCDRNLKPLPGPPAPIRRWIEPSA